MNHSHFMYIFWFTYYLFFTCTFQFAYVFQLFFSFFLITISGLLYTLSDLLRILNYLHFTLSISNLLTLSGFSMKKHCVTHWNMMRTKKVKVTVRRRRVSWASAFRVFSFFNMDFLFDANTLRRIRMLRVKMESQGARTRNMQCTQNS
jgi:hypothetical protein